MSMLTTDANQGFLPEEIGDLVVQPVIDAAVATQVAKVVTTAAHKFHIPIVAADPSAQWIEEGEEIIPSDATFSEAPVTFSKVGGLTIISRELAEDSSPEAAQVVGDGLARDIARKLDTAFFGDVAAPAPSGLESLDFVSHVDADFSSTDCFFEAQSEAEQVGASIGAWVTDPDTALLLATVKEQTGSQRPLLEPDPTQPTRRVVGGVPLWVSPAVTAGTVWGIPQDRTIVVIRRDVTLDVDESAYFSSDRIAVRVTMRVGFGFPHEAAVVHIGPPVGS